jgi:NAD(P)-dependent dehydrogenase (short-subunit alcohol dehydrogenase family)
MSDWVLILGCSTGHGGATAKRLAKDGYGIIGFHFDRGDVKKEAESLKQKISTINNGKVHLWKINAVSG